MPAGPSAVNPSLNFPNAGRGETCTGCRVGSDTATAATATGGPPWRNRHLG
jgi:hypothetical protein